MDSLLKYILGYMVFNETQLACVCGSYYRSLEHCCWSGTYCQPHLLEWTDEWMDPWCLSSQLGLSLSPFSRWNPTAISGSVVSVGQPGCWGGVGGGLWITKDGTWAWTPCSKPEGSTWQAHWPPELTCSPKLNTASGAELSKLHF